MLTIQKIRHSGVVKNMIKPEFYVFSVNVDCGCSSFYSTRDLDTISSSFRLWMCRLRDAYR